MSDNSFISEESRLHFEAIKQQVLRDRPQLAHLSKIELEMVVRKFMPLMNDSINLDGSSLDT